MGGFWRTVRIEEFFGVAMVCRNDCNTAELINCLHDTLQADVDRFHCVDGWLHFTKVADHITARIVDAEKIILF